MFRMVSTTTHKVENSLLAQARQQAEFQHHGIFAVVLQPPTSSATAVAVVSQPANSSTTAVAVV